jgi:hypothetical protein
MRAFKNHEKMTADCAVSVASRRMSARHHTRSGEGVTAKNVSLTSQHFWKTGFAKKNGKIRQKIRADDPAFQGPNASICAQFGRGTRKLRCKNMPIPPPQTVQCARVRKNRKNLEKITVTCLYSLPSQPSFSRLHRSTRAKVTAKKPSGGGFRPKSLSHPGLSISNVPQTYPTKHAE